MGAVTGGAVTGSVASAFGSAGAPTASGVTAACCLAFALFFSRSAFGAAVVTGWLIVRCRTGWSATATACGAADAECAGAATAGLAAGAAAWCLSLWTSTAPPAVSAAVQTTAATLQAVAVASVPVAAVAATPLPPAAAPPAAAPPPPMPRLAAIEPNRPAETGVSAANERRMPRRAWRYSLQPSHERMCRRARPDAFTPRS